MRFFSEHILDPNPFDDWHIKAISSMVRCAFSCDGCFPMPSPSVSLSLRHIMLHNYRITTTYEPLCCALAWSLGSTPSRFTSYKHWLNCSHIRTSIAKQCNMISAKWWWHYAVWKVTDCSCIIDIDSLAYDRENHRRSQGVQVQPPGWRKKFFLGIFWWNEAKMSWILWRAPLQTR